MLVTTMPPTRDGGAVWCVAFILAITILAAGSSCAAGLEGTAHSRCPHSIAVRGGTVPLVDLPQAMFGPTRQFVDGKAGDDYLFGFSPCSVVPSNGINPAGVGCFDDPAFLQQFGSTNPARCWTAWGTLMSVTVDPVSDAILFRYSDGRGWTAAVDGLCDVDAVPGSYMVGSRYAVSGSGNGPYSFQISVNSTAFCPTTSSTTTPTASTSFPPPTMSPTTPPPSVNSSCPGSISLGNGSTIDLSNLPVGSFTSTQIFNGVPGNAYFFGFSPCSRVPNNAVNPNASMCRDNPAFLQQFGIESGLCYASFGTLSSLPMVVAAAGGDAVQFSYVDDRGWTAMILAGCGSTASYDAAPTYSLTTVSDGVYAFAVNLTSAAFCCS